MPLILNRLKRIFSMSPAAFWNAFITRVLRVAMKIRARLFGTRISDQSFLNALLDHYKDTDMFLISFKEQRSRYFFIAPHQKEALISRLRAICPNAEHSILRSADTICTQTFDLLGSGPVHIGWPIEWHRDFKTNFYWNPKQFYSDIKPASFPGGYDLKVPWELSRCQHFSWLGQAYWLTGDEKYAKEFREEVQDWIKQNPPEFGVNWACSMDIAIRAVNWLWGYAFFQESPMIDDRWRLEFCKSLLCHGRHIQANLERTATFTGNHYLSDLVGLIYLGISLPEFKEARNWRDFGFKELESEMFKQVYPDGGNFESSTSYHRLATELFMSATLLGLLNGHEFSRAYMDRLQRMVDFIVQLTKPDGSIPLFGDQDNGRLHRLKVWENPFEEWIDFRPLIAVGAMLFERADWGKLAGGLWEEAIWMSGDKVLPVHEKSLRIPAVYLEPAGFRESGVYVMRADNIYIAVDMGPVGQNGIGGHAHNDTLSFELFCAGRTWIQDPGTYVYTADYLARNMFRSTGYHNTIMGLNYEQNSFSSADLFRMNNQSSCRLLAWQVGSDSSVYVAGELLYHKPHRITHQRSFFLDRVERILLITDWVGGMESQPWSTFHISSGLISQTQDYPYSGIKLITTPEQTLQILSMEKTNIRLTSGWISESYGVRTPADIVSFAQNAGKMNRTAIFLSEGDDVSSRLERVIRHESLLIDRYQLTRLGSS